MVLKCVNCDNELSNEVDYDRIFVDEFKVIDIDFICSNCAFKVDLDDMIKIKSDKPLVMVDNIEFDSPYRITIEEAKKAVLEGKKVSHKTWWESDFVDNIDELEFWVEGLEDRYEYGWRIY